MIQQEKQEKRFYKKFGNAEKEIDNYTLQVTTFDGKYPVLIIFPKKLTKKIREEVTDFLMGELDDHEGFDKFMFLCDLYDTAKRRKINLKNNELKNVNK
ncbi:MAG: hypothetical protein WC758_07845 [Candidatus Woesearchaeota archaeon]|jgi:hypothetical protein